MINRSAQIRPRVIVRCPDDLVGVGGHAVVTKGYDTTRNRVVALKQIRIDERCSSDVAKRVSPNPKVRN